MTEQEIKEYKSLKEKATPKKPIKKSFWICKDEKEKIDFTTCICPNCSSTLPLGTNHCMECGQKIDWQSADIKSETILWSENGVIK